MATRGQRRAAAALYFTADVLVVFLFVVAGRDTRGPDLADTLLDAVPFLAGVVVGWLLFRGWRHPRAVRWTGVAVWLSTVAVALPVRALTGSPTDSRFIVFTFVALGVFLLGWRAIAWVLEALFGRAIEKVVDEKYRR